MSPELSDLPAHSLREAAVQQIDGVDWPAPITREWAWGGSEGAGVKVGLIDSGIDAEHALVGGVGRAVAVRAGEEGEPVLVEDEAPDASGHGTACASVIRSLAPACELISVRVLGEDGTGAGADLLAGLRWAVEQGFDVVNMSLSTSRAQFISVLHDLADTAYFNRTVLVASAHNMPVDSYPWRFSSVVSVASHSGADPFEFHYNPAPPVEFFARGADVQVAWPGGGSIRATGNSFATPHITGLCALIAAKHRELVPFELKSVLRATANNVIGGGP